MQQAKRPVTILAGPYGHPFHPIAVTIPIGAWVSSLVLDIASRFVGSPRELTKVSTWLIVIGLIGAGLAAMIGFLDLFAIPPGTKAFQVALVHMSLNSTVVVLYLINFFIRHSRYNTAVKVGAGPLTLSIIGLALLGIAGFLGGKLAFRYGVRVVDETTQATGFSSADS